MKYLLPTFFTGFIFMLGAVFVSAATVKLTSDFRTLHIGDEFTVQVSADSAGQILNTAEIEMTFPDELLEYVDSDDGSSVINLWIEKPHLKDGRIKLSGITPGGFSGREIKLLSVTFRVLEIGQGNIEISNGSFLLHDGLGTEAALTKQNLHISVVSGDSEVKVNTVDDEIPEHFFPEITSDPDLFAGANVLLFSTEDKGSGMDYFAVKEGRFGRYVVATSPYKIKYQNLDRIIYIKAVDRLGNERIEIIYPQVTGFVFSQSTVLISIIGLCSLVLYAFWKLRRRLQR